jgi:hypothetical protein
MRNLERLLCMSQEKEATLTIKNASDTNKPDNLENNNRENSKNLKTKNENKNFDLKNEKNLNYGSCMMPLSELGVLMSMLYRIQNILVLNSSQFDDVTLRLLQVQNNDYVYFLCLCISLDILCLNYFIHMLIRIY